MSLTLWKLLGGAQLMVEVLVGLLGLEKSPGAGSCSEQGSDHRQPLTPAVAVLPGL